MAEAFQFEAERAPTPIIAARWADSDPYQAEIFYQNEKFTELYGDISGTPLTKFLDTILHAGRKHAGKTGNELLRELLAANFIKNVSGVFQNAQVSVFARVQEHSPKTIQLMVIDTTHHYLDELTGLPTRELFFSRLKTELLRAVREKTEVHLCFLDLDGFKPVNDKFGHHIGDAVLTEVAQRLRALIRRHETVARVGGDEFILLLSGTSIDPLTFATNKVIPAVNAPYTLDGHKIDSIGVSIGITSFPQMAARMDELVTYADDAMYEAKARGKNQAVIFEPDMLKAHTLKP